MSYPCIGYSCPRIPYFSDPTQKYNDITIGAAKIDNARSIRKQAYIIGAISNYHGTAGDTLDSLIAHQQLYLNYDDDGASEETKDYEEGGERTGNQYGKRRETDVQLTTETGQWEQLSRHLASKEDPHEQTQEFTEATTIIEGTHQVIGTVSGDITSTNSWPFHLEIKHLAISRLSAINGEKDKYIIAITGKDGKGITYDPILKFVKGDTDHLIEDDYSITGTIKDTTVNANYTFWNFSLTIKKNSYTPPDILTLPKDGDYTMMLINNDNNNDYNILMSTEKHLPYKTMYNVMDGLAELTGNESGHLI